MADKIDIKNRCLLIFLFLLFSCKGPGEDSGRQHSSIQKPHILLIYTDQQRHNTIQALGNKFVSTPNLDKLAALGLTFRNCFVSAPVCTPSRWSLHSGMYTTSHETYSNHHVAERPATSLPLELKKIGYKTALIGKNHCFLDERAMDIIFNTPKFICGPADGRSARNPMNWKVEEDPMHILTDSAISMFKNSRNGKPHFMWLSYLHPHTPYALPEPFFSMYDSVEIPGPILEPGGLAASGKPFRQIFHQENNDRLIPYTHEKIMRMKRNYYGMVSMIDAEIGRLLEFLEKSNLYENTLIIFTSDHGDYMGDHHMITKSPAMFDCLTRVPLIFSWEGKIPTGIISDELISNVDIMPTILSLVGAEIPQQVQGFSFSELLMEGKIDKSLREYVFAEYGIPGKPMDRDMLETLIPDYKENPIFYSDPRIPWEANPVALAGRFRMIRSKDWKFVEEENGTSELYDMRNDPGELVNLWNDSNYKEIENKLQEDLNNWKESLPGIQKDSLELGAQNIEEYIKKRKNL